MSGLTDKAAWTASYSFGFIPGVLFEGLSRPPEIGLLPDWVTLVTYQFFMAASGICWRIW